MIPLFHLVILLEVVVNFSHIVTQVSALKYVSKVTSEKFGNSVILFKLPFPVLETADKILTFTAYGSLCFCSDLLMILQH